MTPITLTAEERAELFNETATRIGLSPVIVEKDYWVCVALGVLFDQAPPVDLIFKGGTSLSKGYALIERFSEDVDLAFDREGLGFVGERDPEADGHSGNKRKSLIGQLSSAASDYVGGPFREDTEKRLSAILPRNESWSLTVADDDRQALLFAYPLSLGDAYGDTAYVRPVVRLELGARSDQEPCELRSITSMVSEAFGPDKSELTPINVPTLAAERTFWEKATLLHAESHRDHPFDPARSRSRHLYDLVQLAQSRHGEKAIDNRALRDRVVAHKSLYFAAASARYDLFKPGSIQLLPADEAALARLRTDYAQMEPMFFDARPSFDDLIEALRSLQDRLNQPDP